MRSSRGGWGPQRTQSGGERERRSVYNATESIRLRGQTWSPINTFYFQGRVLEAEAKWEALDARPFEQRHGLDWVPTLNLVPSFSSQTLSFCSRDRWW